MSPILELTLRGSVVFFVVAVLDRAFATRIAAKTRRWWWVVVPIAFLLPIHIPVHFGTRALSRLPAWSEPLLGFTHLGPLPSAPARIPTDSGHLPLWSVIWLVGACVPLLIAGWQTLRVMQRWPGERLSTDSSLLSLLEDCKCQAGITAPIGVVVSSRVPSPAILGWLRPRILLPEKLVASMPAHHLRAVLLHELAHFKAADVPLNWLFLLVRIVHWFNPLAHLAAAAWSRFREECADETALRWMADEPAGYGEALLQSLQDADGSVPFGALGFGESFRHLQRRLTMIQYYKNKTPRWAFAALVTVMLSAIALLQPTRAAEEPSPAVEKKSIVTEIETWLHSIDAGRYAESWTEAAPFFQQAITSEKWATALDSVRAPLGKCNGRQLASFLRKYELRGSDGKTHKGEFAVTQFESSFDGLPSAIETVTFQKTPDGTWKASGYFIKPKL